MTDIFNQEETNSENNNNAAADLIVNKLMEIKREDGTPKYASLDAALDALKHSQDYIPRLEQENESLREKTKEVETLQETIKRLNGNNDDGKPNSQTKDEGGRSAEAAEELVKKLLDQKFNERDQINTAKKNILKVQDVLVKKFGDKAQEQLVAKAASLNTTLDKLKMLSAESPDLVIGLFGNTNNSPNPSLGTVNINGKPRQESEIKRPEKSLISGSGATLQNQMEFMAKIREDVYKRAERGELDF